jgi:hypothetical protein
MAGIDPVAVATDAGTSGWEFSSFELAAAAATDSVRVNF